MINKLYQIPITGHTFVMFRLIYYAWIEVNIMQISRLFSIVYYLLEKKESTGKELADRLGVSVRTIYRDINTLSSAGIPGYTNQGRRYCHS
jgi:Predicted transcriptional regulator